MSMAPGPIGITAPTEQIRETGASAEKIREYEQKGTHPGVRQREWGLQARLVSDVTFEEYVYWAKIEREMEEEEYRRYKKIAATGFMGTIKNYFTTHPYEDGKVHEIQGTEASATDEKSGTAISGGDGSVSPIAPRGLGTHELDAEWRTAARALRTAGWGTVFYLITTDILGWSQTPYVFSNTGYGIGAGIFILMGIAAFVSGIMIWRTFVGLDSSRFPILSFGDPFHRLFGPRVRNFINFLQSLQMFLSVAVVLEGSMGVVAQLGGSINLCTIVAGIIVLVVSMLGGYMRSLKHLGWFCNLAIWINIISFLIIIGAAASHPPDPTAQVNNGILNKTWADPATMAPVRTFVGTPPLEYQPTNNDLFAAKFTGINTMVYAYSGAVMFVAFLAEMRRPMDFWKAMLVAQLFLTIVYVVFGVIVYHFYGQYAYSNVNQTVNPASLRVVGNVLFLVTSWLAIFLYFNVGMKTVYLEVGQEIFNLPAITTKKGRYLWWGLGPIYWMIAFVVMMSVPQFSAFTNFVGGLFSLNFTYSFSGIMYLGYTIKKAAALPGEGFDPVTGETTRVDGGIKRYVRGFLKAWKLTIPVLIFTCCGLATSGMGTWSAVLSLEDTFGPGGSVQTSWSCANAYYTG